MCASSAVRRWVPVPFLVVCLSGCDCILDWFGSVPFSLQVFPQEMGDTIPLQRCVLLVTVENEQGQGLTGQVQITATAPQAEVLVENGSIVPGEVAEVTVIPQKDPNADPNEGANEPRTVTVTIVGRRLGTEKSLTAPITVTSEEEDLVGPLAVEVRDLFIPWLAQNRPELGITEQTTWTGTIVTPHILVVTHYLYFSEEWEMHVFWHVMIPPYDWGRIELRRRFSETKPSLAFEIPSRSAEPPLQAQEIDPEEALWR
ncbi:MAG: hypothetical protein JXQ73_26885 [Phycisphaerae bacterium]|nr:hypothetical protein [Phycisphaerae bacterium]